MSLNSFFQFGLLGSYINGHAEELSMNTLSAVMIIGGALCAIVSYLLGSLNFAIIISGKTYKQDIRDFGSKNAGMTNMMRTYGKKAAGLTLLGDAMKAIVSCLIGYALLGHTGAYVAGTACVIGHMYPIYYKFRGGKGVVTTAATILMCDPFIFVILLLLFVGIVALSKYISLGSVMCVLIYPFILANFGELLSPAIMLSDGELLKASPHVLPALLISVLVIYKHRENVKRLMQGKENKFSFKKSVKAPADENKGN
jgi:glycerol-3-phosphate acyltransferase PlsY